MIAIKQAKFKQSSNKIHENQIKNTPNTTAAITASHSPNATATISRIDNNGDRPKQQQALVKSISNDQRNNSQINQHQSNETRSETSIIDGTTKKGAASTKLLQVSSPSSSSSQLPARPSPLPLSSEAGAEIKAASVEQTSSLSTAATSTEQVTTASLTTASTKIQQRQQKFLAAAAKSATSPHHHSNQGSMQAKQATRHKTVQTSPCADCDASHTNDIIASSSRSNKMETNRRYHVSMSIMNGSCCRQAVDCCQFAHHQLMNQENSAKLASTSTINGGSRLATSRVSDGPKNSGDIEIVDSNIHSRPSQSQLGCKKQTMLQLCPSNNSDVPKGVAQTKVLSMATMISGLSGTGIDKIKGGANKGNIGTFNDNKSPRANDDRRPIARAPNASDAASSAASLTPVTVGDINRQVTRSSSCTDSCGSHNTRDHQQEVRRSGENKDIDDNINIKHTTTKHNNHNYYHHYYNHNHLSYHHHQQQHQHQQNYFHLKYQPAQSQSSQPHQSTTQPHHHHQQQHIMAHYKFHNDCQSSVLTYEQVERLDSVMNQVVPIYGRGSSPTLYVKLKELIRLVKYKLQHEHSIEIRDVRLNGGAASYVLAPENSHYNDLDLIFGTDLSNEDRFDVIRDVVLECLMEFYPDKNQAQQRDQSTADGGNKSSKTSTADNQENDSNLMNTVVDDDLEESSGQSLKSERSSSFESDNLNVTTNELEEDSSDEEDNIIVRIDDDDVRDSKVDATRDQSGKPSILCKTNGEDISIKQADHITLQTTFDDNKQGGSDAIANCSIAEQSVCNYSNVPLQGVHYQYNQMPPNNCAIKEAYVHKMVKVNDDDRWSLISLGVQQSETNNFSQQQHQTQLDYNGICVGIGAHASASLSYCDSSTASSYQKGKHLDHTEHQKQFPNSIELKFVDRMRRKFEFSVDSFQIILDSLIQFYDYAPQSTITIQRKSSNMHPASTMIDPKNLMNQKTCGQCEHGNKVRVFDRKACDDSVICSTKKNSQSTQLSNLHTGKKYRSDEHHRDCGTLNVARSFYELPLEPGNSLSNSSVASSSGCSSSSSVVSSSSSSLSCDDEQEDLYCDADSSPSSSVSTSSFLSSTTTSVLSSTGGINHGCNINESKSQSAKHSKKTIAQPDEKYPQQQQKHMRRVPCGEQLDNQGSIAALSDRDKRNNSDDQAKPGDDFRLASKSFRENLCDFGTNKTSSCAAISENFYPTVVGRSEYGNFKEALYHLEKKLIATRSPEEIRGGGLLKYCNLLVKNYKPTNVYQIRTLERYMCSRFFIDFSDLNQQRAKLESYLANHFSDDPMQKFDYLTILHNVVQRSTVCLMNHELRLTLSMIRELAYNLNEAVLRRRQQQQ